MDLTTHSVKGISQLLALLDLTVQKVIKTFNKQTNGSAKLDHLRVILPDFFFEMLNLKLQNCMTIIMRARLVTSHCNLLSCSASM